MNFCFYTQSGEITHILTASSRDIASMQGGDYLVCNNGVSDVTHYVKGGVVLDRKRYEYTSSINGLAAVLEGLPAGSVVYVKGASTEVDSGPTEIEFDAPGTYTLELCGLPQYLDETLEVTVG